MKSKEKIYLLKKNKKIKKVKSNIIKKKIKTKIKGKKNKKKLCSIYIIIYDIINIYPMYDYTTNSF